MKTVAIVGGGLAGLISGIELSKKGVPCRLFEKKSYPLHRVCGEYVSNEAVPYLKKNGLFPEAIKPSVITEFALSSIRGEMATLPLDLGGFGISRFSFDQFLYEKAKQAGVEFELDTEVSDIIWTGSAFEIQTSKVNYEADVVIGSFGKRSRIDVSLKREFIQKKSPYVGIKYHAKTNHPDNLVALHNFKGGYCGVVNVEEQVTNICYLVQRKILQSHENIANLEKTVLAKNPLLSRLFSNADFIYNKPLVINEISFATKQPVENHIIMAGDSAGMIAPLCGNGMAMAIHAGKIAGEISAAFCTGLITREEMEWQYSASWRKAFSLRLSIGRKVQLLFGNGSLSALAVAIAQNSQIVSRLIMRNTHGDIF